MAPPKLVYDIGTGMFLTREMALRVTLDRVAWEHRKKDELLSAPKTGYGLDGYPLQTQNAEHKAKPWKGDKNGNQVCDLRPLREENRKP